MNEDQKVTNTEDIVDKSKPRSRRAVRVGLLVIVIALLGLAGFGAYHNQQSKITQAQTQLTKTQAQLTKSKQDNEGLKSQASVLNKKVSTLTTQLKAQTPSPVTKEVSVTQESVANPVNTDTLGIKVLNGYRYYTTKYPDFPYVVVNATFTNNGDTSVTIPLSSYTLYDSAKNKTTDFGDLTGTAMADGKTVLSDQILSPGQSVTGALAFSVLFGGYTQFTMNYKSQTFQIDASTKVYQ